MTVFRNIVYNFRMKSGKRGRPVGSKNDSSLQKTNYESYMRLRQSRRLQILQREERALQTILVHLRGIKRQLHVERIRFQRFHEDKIDVQLPSTSAQSTESDANTINAVDESQK